MKDDTLKQDDLLRGELVRLVVEEPEVLAQTYVRWFRDSEWSRLMDSGPAYPHSVYALKKWIEEDQPEESGRDYVFQIRTLADDRLVGDIGLEGFKHGRPDAYVGIAIGSRDDWGKGYGTDAMRVLLRYAFQELPLNRVTLNVFEYNPRAVRSYEKAGFRVEGRVRGGLNRDGKRYDMIYMGILRAEWEALQGLPAAGDQRRLPHGFTDRPAAIEDIDAIVQAINAWSRELTGGSDLKPEDLRQQFEIPVFHLERDTRVVVDPAGEIAGYWELWDTSDPHVVMNAWGIVQPRCSGLGIGAYLIDWAEQRARSAIHLAPPDAQVSLHAYLRSNDVRSRRRYRDAGYEHIRNSLRMLIDLNEAPPEPVMPDGIQIRAMRPGVDDEAMTHAVRESFRDHWGFVERPFQDDLDRYRWEMAHDPHFKPELYLLAWDGDQIAGISLCSDYFDEDEAMGWVSTLGVCREWRKRGLGLALLQQSFVELYRHGKARIGLGVDAESLTGATRLYLKAGMRPDPLHEFHLYHKTLRPGKDLSTQSV